MITRLGLAAAACAVLLAVPGGAVAHANPAPGPFPTPQETEAEDAATRVDRMGRERFPDVYAGVELREQRVVIFRMPSAPFDQAVQELRLPVETESHDAPYSARTLEGLAQRVVADIEFWKGQGIQIMSVGSRPDGTAVEVGTPQAAQLGPQLPGRYGTNPPALAEPIGPVAPAG
jgi:hypothetical protein